MCTVRRRCGLQRTNKQFSMHDEEIQVRKEVATEHSYQGDGYKDEQSGTHDRVAVRLLIIFCAV